MEVFVELMNDSDIALVPEIANEQHYEVPPEFFSVMLGEHAKYSCCFWGENTKSLDEAEAEALKITCERAGIENGMSIMAETYGEANAERWFQRWRQAITIADQRYEEYRKSIDFIQRYIFPGSGLPSSAVMTESVARVTDMRLLGLEDIGLHYATTLHRWRDNFFSRLQEVRQQGFSDTFIRMWEYYLCYCEGAFLERAISDVQILFANPQSRLKTL